MNDHPALQTVDPDHLQTQAVGEIAGHLRSGIINQALIELVRLARVDLSGNRGRFVLCLAQGVGILARSDIID